VAGQTFSVHAGERVILARQEGDRRGIEPVPPAEKRAAATLAVPVSPQAVLAGEEGNEAPPAPGVSALDSLTGGGLTERGGAAMGGRDSACVGWEMDPRGRGVVARGVVVSLLRCGITGDSRFGARVRTAQRPTRAGAGEKCVGTQKAGDAAGAGMHSTTGALHAAQRNGRDSGAGA